MFYSAEFLKSPKYGIATCWLVATQSDRSTLKKINRKEIFRVNVPQTCSTIINPESPLALRLQSGLLYGVTRVFHQQCGYVLSDAEHATQTMRELLRVIRSSTAQTTASISHVAKRNQITLNDDPDFDINHASMPIIADHLELQLSSMQEDATCGSGNITTPPSQFPGDQSVLGQQIVVPSSAGSPVGSLGQLMSGAFSDLGHGTAQQDLVQFQLEDPGFDFDVNGNMNWHNFDNPAGAEHQVHTPGSRTQDRDVIEDAGVNLDYVPVTEQGDIVMNEAISIPNPDGPVLDYPEALPYTPPRERGDSALTRSDQEEEQTSESTPIVQAQRARKRRPLALDSGDLELSNTSLAARMDSYAATMQAAAERRIPSIATASGMSVAGAMNPFVNIAGISHQNAALIPAELAMFAGPQLVELFSGLRVNGMNTSPQSLPVATAEACSPDGSVNGRRVRQRLGDEEEVGRGSLHDVQYDDIHQDEMVDHSLEVGRVAETPLADQQLSMSLPWNASASALYRGSAHGSVRSSAVRPSAVRPGSRHGPYSASIRSATFGGSLADPPSISAGQRGSSIAPSPLLGHGTHSFEEPLLEDYLADGILPDDERHDDHGTLIHKPRPGVSTQDFQLYGAAAGVETQLADSLLWQQAALDAESINFLSFVRTSIRSRAGPSTLADQNDKRVTGSIAFDELLPPSTNSRVVAAQGLLHVLSLATKNTIKVEQIGAFEAITLSFV